MKATFTVDIEFDERQTDVEAIASALDRLMATALSTPGIMDEYGDPRIGEFFVAPEPGSRPERWAFYNPDQQTMLTTQTFPSYAEAIDAVPPMPDVLIVKFVVPTTGDDVGDEDNLEDEELP
jgi:hypothetical protein